LIDIVKNKKAVDIEYWIKGIKENPEDYGSAFYQVYEFALQSEISRRDRFRTGVHKLLWRCNYMKIFTTLFFIITLSPSLLFSTEKSLEKKFNLLMKSFSDVCKTEKQLVDSKCEEIKSDIVKIQEKCKRSNPSKMESSEFKDIKRKLDFLEKNIKFFSNVIDAEFSLFNDNGLKTGKSCNFPYTIPAPSSWNYRIVFKIKVESISKWIKGFEERKYINFSKVIKLIPQNWNVKSEPKYYGSKDGSASIAVYFKEGVILKIVDVD